MVFISPKPIMISLKNKCYAIIETVIVGNEEKKN